MLLLFSRIARCILEVHRQYFTLPYIMICTCTTVLDLNECAGDHGCDHLCNNTDGSFQCYCSPGYMLHSNGINCTG